MVAMLSLTRGAVVMSQHIVRGRIECDTVLAFDDMNRAVT